MPIYMDFSAILAIATLVTGLVWGLDTCLFKQKRLAAIGGMAATDEEKEKIEPKLVEYARSFFPILLIVFILRSFIVEPFRIPSGSMKPTLLEGDFILVNKFIYGIRLPVFGTKILDNHQVKRGDILVFRYPKDTSIDFIKRVVGVPGDKITYENKVLYLNGKPLAQTYIKQTVDKDPSGSWQVKQYEEDLSGKLHAIFLHEGGGRAMEEITVPPDHYFVMGDNRDNSEDSRIWGFVPEDLILGKAFLIWMSWDSANKDVRWKRIGKEIN